jgi:hypothetical protein
MGSSGVIFLSVIGYLFVLGSSYGSLVFRDLGATPAIVMAFSFGLKFLLGGSFSFQFPIKTLVRKIQIKVAISLHDNKLRPVVNLVVWLL